MNILELTMMIYDANSSLRSLFPDYDEQALPFRVVIRKTMVKKGTGNPLEALIDILKKVQDICGEDSTRATLHTLWFSAAAVDVIYELNKIE